MLFAALSGRREIAELLIAKGADVNAKNVDGSIPLDYAKGELADLLRKHGGKTGEELKANETPPTHNNRSRGAGGVW